MKIKKFNEALVPKNDDEMISFINGIMEYNIEMKQVKYSHEGDMEIDHDSIRSAAKMIFDELKKLGIDFDIIYATKNYNL